MGWSGGADLFREVIRTIKPAVPDEAARKAIYLKLIPAFEDHDWDTQDECVGEDPAYDAAFNQLNEGAS